MKGRIRNSKYRQLGIPTIFTVGGGFAIIILVGAFMLSYDSFRTTTASFSYADLKDRYTVVEEIELYKFMNHTFFDADSLRTDSMDLFKVHSFALKHSRHLKSFIKSVDYSLLNSEDKKFLISQLTEENYLWDKDKLINTWCLIPSDLAKVNRSDTFDYWEEFKRLFGKYGRHQYSKPLFNRKKDKCIIEHTGHGGWLNGSREIFLFEKVSDDWVLLQRESLWVS